MARRAQATPGHRGPHWRNRPVNARSRLRSVTGMTDPGLLRSTLEALDAFVDGLQRGAAHHSGPAEPPRDATRLVIDEGRGAAEWSIAIRSERGLVHVRVLVVCDVEGDRLTDARLYVGLPSTP